MQAAKAKLNNLRVIIADDEELNLFVLMKQMVSSGYSAKGFDNGTSVWEYLKENPHDIDIVILDKMMDDLNGVEIIKLMKNHPILKNIPIMVQSGCLETNEAIEAGADLYLIKPFTQKTILSAVAELTSVKC